MLRFFFVLLLTIRLASAWTDPALNLTVVQGEGAANNIATRTPHDLVVRVTNSSGPVLGAIVTFTAPNEGAGGAFLNGERMATATTDSQGQAVGKSFRPNENPGRFEVRITASWQNSTAQTKITQFNMVVSPSSTPVQSTAARKKSSSRGKKTAIILAIAGAAAAGGAAALAGGNKSAAPAVGPTAPAMIGITPGASTVGPPK